MLIVEDEPDFRLGLKIRLEAQGFEILEAGDGVTGLNLARQTRPDFIILDLMLPRMGGCQVARLLKFDEKYRAIPIIILTARSQQSDRETGMACGADAYMTKPFRSEELLELMRKLMPV
ncbi:MAG: response regulator [Verrucomicrobiota bacterium]|nr:response regulator [Verrucomicrobiota bacterium]